MHLFKKTSVGTLGAFQYEQDGRQGISLGFYDKEKMVITGIVGLEVEGGKTVLVINDKQFQEKAVQLNVPHKTIDSYLADIRRAEDSIFSLVKERVKELVKQISEVAVTVDVTGVMDVYEQEFYDIGATIYDKHGLHETGLLQTITVDGDIVMLKFCGSESNSDETLGLGTLESWSQAALVCLLESIVKDIVDGKISVEEKDGIACLMV